MLGTSRSHIILVFILALSAAKIFLLLFSYTGQYQVIFGNDWVLLNNQYYLIELVLRARSHVLVRSCRCGISLWKARHSS